MLKECRSHGYFREEFCPHCGDEGKFLLNDEEVEILGRTMAGVLRHFPERYGLEMDAHGWVDLRDFLTAVQIRNRRFRFLRQHHVVGLIETDPKGRYQFDDGKIRATYGHSKDLDLDLPTDGIPDVLFYPTTEEESHLLMEAGLRPSDRKMVHLSATFEAALEAGRVRIAQPLILEIDAKTARESGVVIHRAGKTVYTSKEIPNEFLRRSARVAIDRNLDIVHAVVRNLPKIFPLLVLIDGLVGAATKGDPRQRLFDRIARTTVTRVDQGAYMEEQFRMMQHAGPHPMTMPPAPMPHAPPPAPPGVQAAPAPGGWPGQAPAPGGGWQQHSWDEQVQLVKEMKFCTACGGQLVARGDGKLTCVRCGAVY